MKFVRCCICCYDKAKYVRLAEMNDPEMGSILFMKPVKDQGFSRRRTPTLKGSQLRSIIFAIFLQISTNRLLIDMDFENVQHSDDAFYLI